MYKRDRAWADTYDVQSKNIIKLMPVAHFMDIDQASVERDMKCATDLVLKVKSGDIAVRLRRPGCKYRQLTIRSSRTNGMKTELAKVKEGFAFRYFYGWLNENNIIDEWILVDLDKVRSAGLLDSRDETPNRDGRTSFISIGLEELESAGCLIVNNVKPVPQPVRKVNINVSREEGNERAKKANYYNPKQQNGNWEQYKQY
jgi:hypothetical protein